MDSTIKLWDAMTGQELTTLYGHSDGVTDVAFSPDGTRLYTSSVDGTSREYLLDIEELLVYSKSILSRSFTQDECRKYLHMEQCP
jgi:WD40 repeat protein